MKTGLVENISNYNIEGMSVKRIYKKKLGKF
jgi:hypothetical protein